MAIFSGLSDSVIKRLQQLGKWQRNIRIEGPGVTMQNNPDGLSVYIAQPRPPMANPQIGVLFRVKLSGASGGPPNYTYTVKNLCDETLATTMAPEYRDGWLNLAAATMGEGYIDATTGLFVLAKAWEPLTTKNCS